MKLCRYSIAVEPDKTDQYTRLIAVFYTQHSEEDKFMLHQRQITSDNKAQPETGFPRRVKTEENKRYNNTTYSTSIRRTSNMSPVVIEDTSSDNPRNVERSKTV